MREFRIACAGSRKAAQWVNQKITWSDLCKKLRETIYTSETAAEYRAMSKDDRDAAKDRGGFVGGYLTGGRRRIVNVKIRSLITFDVDTPELDFYKKFIGTFGFAAIIYTTHSHRPGSPRYRIVIALAEDIPPDRYGPVARYLAAEYGIEQFDPVSFVTNQLMHWPSTSKDGEYENEPLTVSAETMADAIRLGRYYLSHALAVYDAIPEAAMYRQAEKVLKMIQGRGLTQFSRRDAMRYCQSFKKVSEIQPVLDFLEDCCYIASVTEHQPYGKGRPPLPKYVVNPAVLS